MIVHCAACQKPIERPPSQARAKGCRNSFCNRVCISVFRKTQTGARSSRYQHGGKGSRLYRIWKGMKSRCYTPTADGFHNYGGRGIRVCTEWLADFPGFRDWALSNGYAANLEIDRRDNDGNYEPGNCRWVTKKVNGRNRRTTVIDDRFRAKVAALVGDGVSYPAIAKKLGVSKSSVFRATKTAKP